MDVGPSTEAGERPPSTRGVPGRPGHRHSLGLPEPPRPA